MTSYLFYFFYSKAAVFTSQYIILRTSIYYGSIYVYFNTREYTVPDIADIVQEIKNKKIKLSYYDTTLSDYDKGEDGALAVRSMLGSMVRARIELVYYCTK